MIHKTIIKLSLLLLVSAPISSLQAQIQKGKLSKGNIATSAITASERHQYKVSLKKNQFAFFKLMQQGVDVKVTTYDSEGIKIQEFDSPNGPYGPELFSITSNKKGNYIVDISPLDTAKKPGSYTLAIQLQKSKATTPNKQVDELFTPWNTGDSPGLAVAVVKDDRIIYKKGYGLANLEYNIPITTSSIFHIASVSKQFTVFSILLLEKQGKLHLNDDIRKYIPEVPDFGKKITLRHLATHTSGLRDQWNLLAMAGWRLDDVITKEHVLKLVSKQKALNFNPGSEYTYCNTGFTLLAEVVSRVSKMSFAEFTKAHIFTPLQMNNTLFYDDHEKVVKNRAYSYYSTHTGYKKNVLSYANVGATSLFTTVEDLGKWSLNFNTHIVGDATIFNTMNTPAILNNGKKFGGALGQFVGKYKGLNEIQHGGADAGYRSYLTRFPEENFSVIVFSNSAEFNAGGMAHKVVDIYLKDRIKVTPKKKKTAQITTGKSVTVSENILNTYTGEFELQPGFTIQIKNNNGALTAKATGQSVLSLSPISITEFNVKGVAAKIEFIPNKEKNITLIKLHQGGRIMKAKRVEEFDTNSVNLAEFSGEFYSEELSTSYHFSVVDGKLVSKHSRLSDFTMNPTKNDIFAGNVWFFGLVEFIRNNDHKITGCKVSNGRVRNLYFRKVK